MTSAESIANIAYSLKAKWKKLTGLIFLRNKEITIISNNCIGGALYHDYKLQFNSPFINVNISMEHYLQICRNLQEYMQAELQQVDVTEEIQDYFYRNLGNGKVTFPVGKLVLPTGEKVMIFFQHYETFAQSKEAWNRRKERIDYNNLFFVAATNVSGNERYCAEFACLPYPAARKLLLTVDIPLAGSGIHTRFMDVPKGVHFLTKIKGKSRCYYWCFPYLKWFWNPDTIKS
mgnify:FL=1